MKKIIFVWLVFGLFVFGCSDLPKDEEDPITGNGTTSGDTSPSDACVDGGHGTDEVACCLDGQCQMMPDKGECVNSDGTVFSDLSDCKERCRQQERGACCVDGACYYVTYQECKEKDPAFFLSGKQCTPGIVEECRATYDPEPDTGTKDTACHDSGDSGDVSGEGVCCLPESGCVGTISSSICLEKGGTVMASYNQCTSSAERECKEMVEDTWACCVSGSTVCNNVQYGNCTGQYHFGEKCSSNPC